jgi:hypothetical protein
MKGALLIACLIGTCAAQSVKSCGKAGDLLSNAVFSVSPDPIQKGAPLTITATGTWTTAFTDGNINVDLNIKALGIINEPVKVTSPFTFSPGFVAGDSKIVIGPFTPPKVPGTTTVSGTITGTDASGKSAFCVALDLDASQPPEAVYPIEAGPVASNCGKDTDHLKNIKVTQAGGVTTITGTQDEAIASGSVPVDLSVKVSFIKIPVNMNIPFTVSPAMPAGDIKVSVGPSSSGTASNINVDVEGTVKINDGNSEEIACVSLTTPSAPMMLTLNKEWLSNAVNNSAHYEDPKPNGCQSDEQAIQIQGVSGDFCTPKCDASGSCPTDVPSGVTAAPTCALQDQSGNKYCALICSPSENDSCGTATCKSIQGTGICTYDD